MTPFRQQFADIDWERTAALTVVIGFLLFPLRWIWRRILVRLFADALREVLKDDLAPLKQVSACAEELSKIAARFESVDDDITVLFDIAFGIDRRSWEERRETLRPGAVDRRRRHLPILHLDEDRSNHE